VLIPIFLILLANFVFAADYYVATDGSDSNDGSEQSPWATIDYAVTQLPQAGGDTIIVKDGVYNGRTFITEAFDNWITIRAENDFGAKLTNIQSNRGGEAFGIFTPTSVKIIIEGFIISNAHSYSCGDREANVLIHFESASDIEFRNNIVFGNNVAGSCNELLKVNRGGAYYPRNIQIHSNVFYDHVSSPGADIIDSVRPGELDIYDNIFFSRNAVNAQSFITLKREVPASNPEAPGNIRSPRYKIYRNVFLSWHGRSDQAFIQLGEDAVPQYEITDALIENNLFIGNSDDTIVGAMQFKGPRDVTVRANTIVGDHPGSAYGFRIGTEGENPTVEDIFIYNNIWSDPTGTMSTLFINTYGDVNIASIELDNNLFWNNGNALPTQEDPAPEDDASRIEADPLLENNQNNIVLPVWDENAGAFISGNTAIRDEFERLIYQYGAIADGSPAIDAANPANMPADDILGNSRDANPDIGCYELVDGTPPVYENCTYGPIGGLCYCEGSLRSTGVCCNDLWFDDTVCPSECSNWQANHPDWLLCEDFEDYENYNDFMSWYADSQWLTETGHFNPSGPNGRITIDSNSYLGDYALHMPHGPDGSYRGSELRWFECAGQDQVPCTLDGYDELYIRTYVKFAADHDYVHHFLTMGASQPDGFYGAMGLAGCRPNGEISAGSTVDFNADFVAHGRRESRESFFYTYSVDMRCDPGYVCDRYADATAICNQCASRGLPCTNGEECCWGNSYPSDPTPDSVLPREEWICLEMMMEMNTPGQSDGRMAYWINDNLIHEETTMFWRTIPELQLNRAALQHYVTSGEGAQWGQQRVWWDNAIISTERIGCLGYIPPDPEPCDPVPEICGNGIDEDCNDEDLLCPPCPENVTVRCMCGTQIVESGYCCNVTPQVIPCPTNQTNQTNETVCTLPVDQPTCNCIDLIELRNSIQSWYDSQITMVQLMTNIRTWKECSDP